MNILIAIVIVIVAIVVLLLIAAAFTKADYAVERRITINKPVAQVFGYIRYLKNMENYNKWVMMDPLARKDYRGEDGTEGFIYAWDSDNKQAGQGEQVIKHIDNGKQIDYEIQFVRPFKGLAKASIATDPIDAHTTIVTWNFASKMPYPMNAMLMFMDMGEMLGKDLTISLGNLKEVLEKQP